MNAVSAGEVEKLSRLNRKEVDKTVKTDGTIVSSVRCNLEVAK